MVSNSLWVGCAAVRSAVVVAARGSSGGSHPGGSHSYVSFIKFAGCMRSHGVPAFPDLSTRGGGVPVGPGDPERQLAGDAAGAQDMWWK